MSEKTPVVVFVVAGAHPTQRHYILSSNFTPSIRGRWRQEDIRGESPILVDRLFGLPNIEMVDLSTYAITVARSNDDWVIGEHLVEAVIRRWLEELEYMIVKWQLSPELATGKACESALLHSKNLRTFVGQYGENPFLVGAKSSLIQDELPEPKLKEPWPAKSTNQELFIPDMEPENVLRMGRSFIVRV